MKVAIDAHWVTNASKSGIPYYTLRLIQSLLARSQNQYTLTYFDKGGERKHRQVMQEAFGSANMVECNSLKYPDLFGVNCVFNEKSYPELFGISPDVSHFIFQTNVPPHFKGVKVVTIHDTLNIDVNMAKKYLGVDNNFASGVQHSYYKLNALNPDMIIADSKWTKQCICDFKPEWADRTRVVYLGFDSDICELKKENYIEILKRFSIRQPYLLFMGLFNPHKNIDGIIKAFEIITEKHKELSLVLCGSLSTPWFKDIIMNVVSSPKRGRIHVTGVVSEYEKQALFSGAEAFVFPSKHEGFGLPILEAQEFGIPLITSNTTSCNEIAGDGALLVNPYSIEEIVDAIERVLTDTALRNDLIRSGHENTKRFSWDRCAAEAEEVYKEAYEGI